MKIFDADTHNVDYAEQTLSLLLGCAAYAHFASQYSPNIPLFDRIEWTERYNTACA